VDVERVALSVRVGRRAEEVAARKKRRTDLETQDVWPQPMSITRIDLRSGVAARSARRVSDARARERVGGRGELQGTKGDERVGAIAECARRAHTPRDDVLASQGAVDAGRREIDTAVAVERVEAFPTAVARIRIAAPALVFDGETRRSAAGKRVAERDVREVRVDVEHALVGRRCGSAPRSGLPDELDLEVPMRGPAFTPDPQAGNRQAPVGRLAISGIVARVERMEVHL